MRFRFWLMALGLAMLGFGAHAQPLRGTVVSVDGRTLTVATRDGRQAKIMLDENYAVGAVKKIDPAQLAQGAYVGVSAEPVAGGGWKAQEVFLMAGPPSTEGHFPWDLTPGASMTNAMISAVVNKADGKSLTLTYKAGTTDIAVPEGIPLVTSAPAERSDLKPGAYVVVFVRKQPDGTLTAARPIVEKDGVKPPM
jgi:hypothetical protein